jgi:glycine cleavage system H protein
VFWHGHIKPVNILLFESYLICFGIGVCMQPAKPKTLQFKRSHFATQLPVDYLYSASHAWIARHDAEHWRVGLTKFATRMLGEMVDHGFELEIGVPVQTGQIVGWVEGFKAISDLYCIGAGQFAGGNPGLQTKISLLDKDPYGAGWLYLIKGHPDSKCVDVHAYHEILHKTIDRILAQQKADQIT